MTTWNENSPQTSGEGKNRRVVYRVLLEESFSDKKYLGFGKKVENNICFRWNKKKGKCVFVNLDGKVVDLDKNFKYKSELELFYPDQK